MIRFILNIALLCMIVTPSAADQALEESAQNFVSLLERGDFDRASDLFDKKMKKAVPPVSLKAIWDSQQESFGAFQGLEETRTEVVGGYNFVFVQCRFEKGQQEMKVVFDKAAEIAGLFFVPVQSVIDQTPEYAKSELFQETEVEIGHGEWVLPGTITLPVGKGPFPALILVHGSGPQDRDETVGPNKPFRDLAWGLASRGVAVLRYEKRTKHYAKKLVATIGSLTVREEAILDAAEAVSLLQKTRKIDAGRIFVLGHSLGGMLLPRIGEGNPEIAGLIFLAANARPLEDLILEQTLYQVESGGNLSDEGRQLVSEVEKQVDAIKDLPNKKVSGSHFFGVPESYWRDLADYKPAELANTIGGPLLILQGEKDCQVSAELDFGEWKRGLSERNNVEFGLYPALNHLFMRVEGVSTGAEYQQPGNVSAEVVEDIADWIARH